MQAADVRRYPLADRGAILLTVPEGWREEVRRPDPNLPPTIIYSSLTGASFQVLVTPIWPFSPDIPQPSEDELRENVRSAGESVRPQAVETEIKIEEFRGSETFAWYFSVTDRAPQAGAYRYMTQGIMGLADLRVTFTMLTNDGSETIVPRALDMLKGARRERAGGAVRPPSAAVDHRPRVAIAGPSH